MPKTYYVYILTNASRASLYTAVAGGPSKRIHEHKDGTGSKFASKYKTTVLVYAKAFKYVKDALRIRNRRGERRMYQWRRASCICAIVLSSAVAAANDAALYFPPADGAWQTVAPEDAGWDAEKLDEALRYAGETNSSGVVVLHKGRILAERYWELDDPSERYQRMKVGTTPDGRAIEDVASVQKSVVSFLVAVARERASLKLSDRVSNYLDIGWSDTHRDREHEITLHQIMSMTSGLKPDLSYQAEPGTLWRYNTRAYSKMVRVLEVASKQDIESLTRDRLTEPTGMVDSRWAERTWLTGGIDANKIGFATTARDLARFGLLILADGAWKDTALITDTHLLDDMFETSQRLNPAYGLLWWLNGKERFIAASRGPGTGPLVPTAPDDMIAALGALGRKCYVVPSLGLVVTRLGDAPGPNFDREFWRRLSAAAPDAAPEG